MPSNVPCRILVCFCAVLAGPAAAGFGCGEVVGVEADASVPDVRVILADPSVADVLVPADATAGVEAATEGAGIRALNCRDGGSWPPDAETDCVTCPLSAPAAGSPCTPTGPPELECEYDSDAGCGFFICDPDAGWALYDNECAPPGSRPRLGSACSGAIFCGSGCGPRFVCNCGSWRLGPADLPCVL